MKLLYKWNFLFLLLVSINAQVYLDPNADVEARVNDLISRMTLDEKIGQMTQAGRAFLDNDNDINLYYLGSILSGGGSSPNPNTPESWANMYDQYQQYALNTRLKIPLIYGIDAVHGHNNVKGAVIFPHNIGLGATRNPELIKLASQITAKEVAATGIDWTFAPCIAVPLNEKWGRTYEGFGETVELAEMAATASIVGYQGNDLADNETILACAKHFVGDGGTTNGIDQGNTEVNEEVLRAIHMPGYIKAIEAGVGTIMASYSSWNGEKLHGHHYLLTTVLKEELGFDGFIVSDWAGIDQLPGNYKDDIKQSINAGIDMVMVPDNYIEYITLFKELANENQISAERIDDAVKRILRIKFRMGLFENPYTDRSLLNTVGSAEHRAIARECVRESVVILQKKDDVLPLKKENQKIALIGKGADDIGLQSGGWTIYWQGGSGDITEGTTLLEAFNKKTNSSNIVYSESGNNLGDSEIAVIVIAEDPYAEYEGFREDLTILNKDVQLVKNAKEQGLKTIVVLYSGRPMIINPLIKYSDAIIAAWLPGTEGDGIADVLFGDFEPRGKLPHTWPKYMDQIPINFGDSNYDPLFEYGFGLTSIHDSEIGSAPSVFSAYLNDDGKTLELTLNKKIDFNSIESSNFTLIGDEGFSSNSVGVSSTTDSNTISITFETAVQSKIKLSLKYNSGTIKSLDGGVLNLFSNKFVFNGLFGIGAINTIPGKVEAENYISMEGIQTQPTDDIGGGENIGWIDSGDWLEYDVNILATGTYKLNYRIASESQAGIIQLENGDEVVATTLLPVTGGWQTWRTVSTEVSLTKGENKFRINAVSGGFNLNWFSFDLLVSVDNTEMSITEFTLLQNYPNPFNPNTIISIHVPQESNIELEVFNSNGELVKTIYEGYLNQGKYNFKFNAENLASGIYFYKLKTPNFQSIKKMILLK